MKTFTVFAFIILGFYLIGCIRPHVIISMKKYMNIYVKIFFIKFRVSTSQKFEPPDEELLDLPKKKKKPEKPKKPAKPKPTKEEKEAKKKEKPKKDKKMPKKPIPLKFGIDIVQILANLVYSTRKALVPLLVMADTGIGFADKRYATCRGAYDIVVLGKQLLHTPCQRLGIALIACITHRLTTTGLLQRIIDIQTERSEQPIGGRPDLGIERIDITRDKESYLHPTHFF